MALQASVISYEDATNAAGEILTKYIVEVKYLNATYTISKRYSEFKTLYDILKDVIPAEYKFPNKSMFHNSAQATKERRIRGFDELLQILLTRNPVPPVMEKFLAINDKRAKSLQIRSKSLNMNKSGAGSPRTPGGGNNSVNRLDDNASTSTYGATYTDGQIVVVPEPRPSTSREVTYSPEKYELIKTLRREAPNIIMSSMKATSAVYILLVIVRLVDISNSDFSEILLTMCILSFAVSFVRINLLKMALRGGTPAKTEDTTSALPVSTSSQHATESNNASTPAPAGAAAAPADGSADQHHAAETAPSAVPN